MCSTPPFLCKTPGKGAKYHSPLAWPWATPSAGCPGHGSPLGTSPPGCVQQLPAPVSWAFPPRTLPSSPGFDRQSGAQTRTDEKPAKLGGFYAFEDHSLSFPLCFPVKPKAALKAANKPLGLFVLGFMMKGAAKDNELTAKKKKKSTRKEG